MGLKLRVQKTDTNPSGVNLTSGVPLTYQEGDSNFVYLLTNMSGSNVKITGSTGILGDLSVNGAFTLLGLSNSSGANVIMYNTTTGQFFYQSTSSINVGSASYISSSKVNGPYGMDSIRSASYASGSTSASYALSSSYAFSSSYAVSSSSTISSSYALTASYTPGAGAVANNLTQGIGIVSFSYNGGSAQTVAVSGAVSLSTNNITKWTGTAFANSSLTDNGTTITGNTSIQLTGANSSLSGSFSGSFIGYGGSLTGVTATPNFPTTALTNLASTDKFFVNDDASDTTVGNKKITYANLLTDLAGTNLAVESSDSLTLATTITGLTSVSSTAFTGSILGTASTASFVTASNVYGPLGSSSVSNALTASYVSSSFMKAGGVSAGTFTSTGGDNYKATVTFPVSYPAGTSYAVSIMGGDARSWTVESKGVGQFTINSNSKTALTAEVNWITVPY
jgi:hypothetical protein